ncbi:MAG TPA: hypothetical protein VIN59_08325 [Alphaproteobacteria bacterium]
MKRILFTLAAALIVFTAAPAHACKCAPDTTGARAQQILNDPSISVARVYVRGMNVRNGQSMLELRETLSGGLMARNFRAKFGGSSCGFIPSNRTEQIVLVKFEKDGTYSLIGDCARTDVLEYMKTNKLGQ